MLTNSIAAQYLSACGLTRRRWSSQRADDLPILVTWPAAHSEKTQGFAVLLEWDAACEDHHSAAVRRVDTVNVLTWLGVIGEVLGLNLKARDVRAVLIDMSTLPIQAPSWRAWAIRLPPASTTAMFIGWPTHQRASPRL